MMPEEIELQLIVDVQLNKRVGKVKTKSWFPITNDIVGHQDFYDQEDQFPQIYKVFLYIRSRFSHENKDRVRIHLGVASDRTKASISDIIKVIGKLNQKRWKVLDESLLQQVPVEHSSSTQQVPVEHSSSQKKPPREEKRREEERTTLVHFSVDDKMLESVYQKYPRKEGKSKGLKILKPKIKTQQDLDDLSKAVDKYASMQVGKEKEFIMIFKTFAGCWRDYLDPDVGTVVKPKGPPPKPYVPLVVTPHPGGDGKLKELLSAMGGARSLTDLVGKSRQ